MIEISFNSSIATQCQIIPVISDAILENNETFLINLNASDTDVLLENNSATITVTNDDRKFLLVNYFVIIMS